MVLRGTDQFVDLPQVRVDAALRQQTIVHVRQLERRPTAWSRGGTRRPDDVHRCTLQRIQVQVIGAAGKQVHSMVPHGADTERGVLGNFPLDLQTSLQYIGNSKLRRNERNVWRSLE